jgi:hypothetical protein
MKNTFEKHCEIKKYMIMDQKLMKLWFLLIKDEIRTH